MRRLLLAALASVIFGWDAWAEAPEPAAVADKYAKASLTFDAEGMYALWHPRVFDLMGGENAAQKNIADRIESDRLTFRDDDSVSLSAPVSVSLNGSDHGVMLVRGVRTTRGFPRPIDSMFYLFLMNDDAASGWRVVEAQCPNDVTAVVEVLPNVDRSVLDAMLKKPLPLTTVVD